jgi:hypothetical protein
MPVSATASPSGLSSFSHGTRAPSNLHAAAERVGALIASHAKFKAPDQDLDLDVTFTVRRYMSSKLVHRNI